jgi:hypothetical protein
MLLKGPIMPVVTVQAECMHGQLFTTKLNKTPALQVIKFFKAEHSARKITQPFVARELDFFSPNRTLFLESVTKKSRNQSFK